MVYILSRFGITAGFGRSGARHRFAKLKGFCGLMDLMFDDRVLR